MEKQIIQRLQSSFDSISHITEDNIEYWLARELQTVLGYKEWRNFNNIIVKAKVSCEQGYGNTANHFVDVNKMVEIGSGAGREISDIALSRYACYLIAMNGDPSKNEIAFAQSYFAVQTRKAEIIEQRLNDLNRLQLREQLKTSEKRLSQNIYERGVDDAGFGRIRSKGDRALFGGYTTQEMKDRLGVKDTRPLADFLPPVTIAAKNLATEMTNLNIESKDLQGEPLISNEHVQNNLSVRDMLTERGIVPEQLPPEEDIKKLKRRVKSEEKKLASKTGALKSK